VWCPKYRRPVLEGEVATALAELLREKVAALGCEVEALEVMPDHVHLFVEAPPTLAPQQIVAQCKGYTSRVLRERFPSLKSRLPSLWNRSYYAGSAGHVSAATVRRYIAGQKGR
jgi:REP-associated tyrosine transposase